MPFKSRDEFLSRKPKLAVEKVPFLGDVLILQELSAADRGEMEEATFKYTAEWGVSRMNVFRGMLIAFCGTDEDGKRLFVPEDAREIGSFPWSDLEPAVETCLRLCKIGERERKLLEGESKPGPNAGLSSESPGNGASETPTSSSGG